MLNVALELESMLPHVKKKKKKKILDLNFSMNIKLSQVFSITV